MRCHVCNLQLLHTHSRLFATPWILPATACEKGLQSVHPSIHPSIPSRFNWIASSRLVSSHLISFYLTTNHRSFRDTHLIPIRAAIPYSQIPFSCKPFHRHLSNFPVCLSSISLAHFWFFLPAAKHILFHQPCRASKAWP